MSPIDQPEARGDLTLKWRSFSDGVEMRYDWYGEYADEKHLTYLFTKEDLAEPSRMVHCLMRAARTLEQLITKP